jgi:hypothetical protein
MYFNYDNTVTIETTGKDHAGAATWALCDIVEGKAFVDDRCIQSIGRGCKPLSEGMRLFFADDPDDVPDTDISIIPFLSDDGRALLKIVCHSMQGGVNPPVEEEPFDGENASLEPDDDLPF